MNYQVILDVVSLGMKRKLRISGAKRFLKISHRKLSELIKNKKRKKSKDKRRS